MSDEEEKWWEEHKDEVDPVIEDEIDGDTVISLDDLQDEEESQDNDDDDDDDDSDDD